MNRRSFIEKAGLAFGAIASPFRMGPVRWAKFNWGRYLAWKMGRTRGLVIYPKVHWEAPTDPDFNERMRKRHNAYRRICILHVRNK